ncbi:DUF6632 domain-containing protein [Pseudomonas sp. N040]|uniref:DUF6632 domain-containing protein n=1 Tax=Pseudomonas sp. N040 TaxID=2785325 RepID=UPI0018A2E089|nr:DUF6632 domain-containing protein [Pseudomonas sp. N040]MBF7730406.1 hypothetical protein [Pseudomonas sp. N040]MBW7014048.1 hypothetical protein [Pseudomonas sp. N040]
MENPEKHLQRAALAMKIVGWACLLGLPLAAVLYPPGVLWGQVSPEVCFPNIGPAHPLSPYNGLHPYFFMLASMYIALGFLMLRGARDPLRNVGLFDYGIYSSILHGGIMIPMAFYYPNEHAHMWADIPFAALVAILLIIWHPKKAEVRAAA